MLSALTLEPPTIAADEHLAREPQSQRPTIRLPEPGQAHVEVTGLQLGTIEPALAAELRELAYVHQLVVLRGLDPDDVTGYIDFARSIGTIEPYFQAHYHHPEHPEIFVSTNVPMGGEKVGVAGTGRMWHADYSFFERPLAFTMVRPMILPAGRRETYYIDMRRVYAELPDHLRQAAHKARCMNDAWDYYKVQPFDIDKAVRELIEQWHREAPGAVHPAVITHPFTHQPNLFVSRGFTKTVENMPHEQGQELLAELFDFCEQERFVHHQQWQVGDILFWDNRSMIHHASTVAKAEQSRSYRISLYDELPFDGG